MKTGGGKRPEGSQAPDHFYDDDEAHKYDSSSRMRHIQAELSQRAIEMLSLPAGKPCYILDVGCGSGLSGAALEEAGHYWVGCDISRSMLNVASERDSTEISGDLLSVDMGQGLPFRPGTFDGVVSISALQWLCYADTSEQDPRLRLNRFFSSLYSVMKRDARAVLQFYPENAEQAVIIAQSASRVGFAGGIVIDYPNSSKAKKYYLCLSFERTYQIPAALGTTGGEATGVQSIARDTSSSKRDRKKGGALHASRPSVKSRDWVLQKKERQRKQGKVIKSDSKFSGRKRSVGF